MDSISIVEIQQRALHGHPHPEGATVCPGLLVASSTTSEPLTLQSTDAVLADASRSVAPVPGIVAPPNLPLARTMAPRQRAGHAVQQGRDLEDAVEAAQGQAIGAGPR